MKTVIVLLGVLAFTTAMPQAQEEPVESELEENLEADVVADEEDIDEGSGSGDGEGADYDLGLGAFQPTYECSEDAECPPYHFCFASAYTGTSCQSNLYTRNFTNCDYCKGFQDPKDDSTAYPATSFCQLIESEARGYTEEERPHSCYEEIGFCCAEAYFMPCKPDDSSACPKGLGCVEQTYSNGETVNLCKPEKTEFDYGSEIPCEKAYDCPWSILENSWSICSNGVCLQVLER
ncbi:uncharacterized protein LOC131890691 [Tigriopus californicus]|uniref:uncharacterized protein LOC131890691 n=1 Tax=Tigriopus californicus TaxID=6832 RepID=UPI0027D9F146|nr:uncharacterized protein LOC131890691 [Tigriopus californicus]|eukprot:TCALIF_06626-PA protein Name:"Protein of unknown function" AED:0.00 eAED:0.00 QI:93/1/1/1/1/1/4/98/234